MNNIKRAAIRLIANAYLFGRDKKKNVTEYRFDSSFLTKRKITSIKDLEELQTELNRMNWCFNILSFNDYIIQDKSFLAEVTKLGFGRVKEKNEKEVLEIFRKSQHEKVCNQLLSFLQENSNIKGNFTKTETESSTLLNFETLPGETLVSFNITTIVSEDYDLFVKITLDKHADAICEFNIPTSYSVIKENGTLILNIVNDKIECDSYIKNMEEN